VNNIYILYVYIYIAAYFQALRWIHLSSMCSNSSVIYT